MLKIREKIHNLKWERLQNLFDTISWFLVKSPVFLPEISWFSKFWSGMSGNGLLPDGIKPLPEPILTYQVFRGIHNVLGDYIFYSLWPSDAIWRHRSGSTLGQVMACCLTAPSHYLTQCWLIISESSDHQLRAISQEMPQPSITKVSLKL